MKKRVMTWLLPMLLLLLLPVAAWAVGDVAEVTAPDGTVTMYTDVDTAVEVWKDNGGTLKLLQDCKSNNTAVVTATNAVLDLNGCKLERAESFSNPSNPSGNKFFQPIIQINGNGILTIKDSGQDGSIVNGQADSFDGYKKLVMVQNLEASLVLAGGTLDGGGQCTVDMSGSFEMTGGTIKNDNVGVSALNGAKRIEISDGIFSGTGDAVKVGGKNANVSVIITGGTFHSGGLKLTNKLVQLTLGTIDGNASDFELPVLSASNQPQELKILSGTLGTVKGSKWTAHHIAETVRFKDDSIKSHLPSGMKLVSNGDDGTYKVATLNDTDPETGACIVKADGSKVSYLSAIAAASGLQNGETLVLKKNVTEDIMIINAVDVVIDLNGNAVTPPGDRAEGIQINAPQAGTVTLKNGAVARENGHYGVKVSNKGQGLVQVIVENVKFTLPNAANPIYMGENVYMINTPENVVLHGDGGFIFDGKLFTSLSTAQKLAQGQEIVLANDVRDGLGLTSYVEVSSVINLNGHSYTYSKKNGAAIELTKENQALTVKNGSINATYKYDPNKKPSFGSNPQPYTASGALLISNNQSLILDNVKLTTAGGYGISGNGTNENNTITLQNGSVVTTTAEGFPGIYFPCDGTLTIDNSEVHGMANGVQMCDGHLVVRGDKTRITASGADESNSKTGDGPIPDGAAISIVKRGGGYGDVTANIEGGQFESEKTEAVNAFTWDAANKKQEAWDNAGKAVQVQGGQFSSSVDESLLDDKLTVELNAPGKNPDAPFSYHSSVEDAMSQAAGEGSEIKDLTNPVPETGSVTVTLNSSCTELANVTIPVAKDGTLILPSPSRDGYRFDGWQAQSGTIYQGGSSLKVEDAMVLTALWSKVNVPVGPSNPSYPITIPSVDNGSVTVVTDTAKKGDLVSLTVTPDTGYVVDAVAVVDKNGQALPLTDKGNGTYTFTMPASKVEIVVTFKVGSGLPFTDVNADDWYYGPVEYVFNNGIMNGTGDGTTFSPNVPLNRAMIAAVLYNLEGGPVVDNDGAFTDVPSGEWYTDAVNWAASEGIVGGIGDGLYAPNANLTREQMASVLYRYAQYKGIDVSKRADLTTFVDGTSVSPWATEVVQWAVAEKLINGAAGNTLQPQGIASRAQVATVLMNFCENVAK